MAEPLKNGFGLELVSRIASAAADECTGFERDGFVAAAVAPIDDLELKDRINYFADTLHAFLPGDWEQKVKHLAVIADAVTPDDADAFGDMAAWPMCSVVERHGLHDPHASLDAMEQLTQSFSCEFAIRPFLIEHLDATIARCHEWTASDLAAVRRLASEGTRPHLPWGAGVPALLADPDLGIDLITELRHDPDEVVRRSVANHLNDVARRHPDRVAALAQEWADEGVDAGLVRHSLRSLVKKGHPGAMAALDFTTEAKVDVAEFSVSPDAIRLGTNISLNASIQSTGSAAQRVVVDFVIHHVNANGDTSAKVFKWTTLDLEPGETVMLSKTRKIATASTRRYHAGVHRVDLQIAGTCVASSAFDLLDASDG